MCFGGNSFVCFMPVSTRVREWGMRSLVGSPLRPRGLSSPLRPLSLVGSSLRPPSPLRPRGLSSPLRPLSLIGSLLRPIPVSASIPALASGALVLPSGPVSMPAPPLRPWEDPISTSSSSLLSLRPLSLVGSSLRPIPASASGGSRPRFGPCLRAGSSASALGGPCLCIGLLPAFASASGGLIPVSTSTVSHFGLGEFLASALSLLPLQSREALSPLRFHFGSVKASLLPVPTSQLSGSYY